MDGTWPVTKYLCLNFQHGMGKLRITDDGIRLEGRGEFLDTLYVQEIKSKSVSWHFFRMNRIGPGQATVMHVHTKSV